MQKILVIDDEDIFRQTTAATLQRKGFEAHEAADGSDGLEIARRILPDLVLCDVNMSQMDGYATLQALRKEPATATIPFILMTGLDGADIMRRGMNLGADDFLEKPFTAPQLFAAVHARLQKQQTLQQSAEKKLADLRASLSLALPHEMLTPLNGIFGLADVLSTDAANMLPEEVAEVARGITASAERLHHLVQNFVLFGQLELLETDPEAQADLRGHRIERVRQLIAERLASRAEKCGRTADADACIDDAVLRIGPEMFTRLVDELLDNAFKFSAAGERVKVTGRVTGQIFTLSIADEGDGMDAVQVAQIGAYSQFDRKNREQQGSGLGLAIVKRLAKLHQGQFQVKSERDCGTTVTVKLPLAA